MRKNGVTIKKPDGSIEWVHLSTDKYSCTGLDRNGKRFRIESASWPYIRSINVWGGNKWLIRNGKRYLIQRITN